MSREMANRWGFWAFSVILLANHVRVVMSTEYTGPGDLVAGSLIPVILFTYTSGALLWPYLGHRFRPVLHKHSIADYFKESYSLQRSLVHRLLPAGQRGEFYDDNSRREMLADLLETAGDRLTDEEKYHIHIGILGTPWKLDDVNELMRFAKSAVEIRPNGMLANYLFGKACECKGMAHEAIAAYSAACNEERLDMSIEAKLKAEVERIRKYGVQCTIASPDNLLGYVTYIR